MRPWAEAEPEAEAEAEAKWNEAKAKAEVAWWPKPEAKKAEGLGSGATERGVLYAMVGLHTSFPPLHRMPFIINTFV